MEDLITTQEAIGRNNWKEAVGQLSQKFEERAGEYDRKNVFVHENYEELRSRRMFSAAIPEELGGGGMSHESMCHALRTLARGCSSTALALSMHQHLIATNVWKYKRGQGGESVLASVAKNQTILISTGAGDWLKSNGKLEKTGNGYFMTAQKHFASQAPAGNVLITSAVYKDPENGAQVYHFPVPMDSPGVAVMDNWDALGMKGTGSHTILLKDVFIPEESIVLRRKRGAYHPFFNVVLTAAMPMIMAVYVGVAEKAAALAMEFVGKKENEHTPYLVAEMINELTAAQVLWRDMVKIANDLDFEAVNDNGSAIAVRKTIVADACIKTVNKAMEVAGGKGYLRPAELERLYRDVQASRFHPLQPKEQHAFTGEHILSGEPGIFE